MAHHEISGADVADSQKIRFSALNQGWLVLVSFSLDPGSLEQDLDVLVSGG